jgi:uncharacterized protein (DUF433 family)
MSKRLGTRAGRKDRAGDPWPWTALVRLINGRFLMKQLTRITLDPAVMGGKASIRGLRVTVGTVVGLLAAGRSRDEILRAYPYLEPEDIDEALAYAPGAAGPHELVRP